MKLLPQDGRVLISSGGVPMVFVVQTDAEQRSVRTRGVSRCFSVYTDSGILGTRVRTCRRKWHAQEIPCDRSKPLMKIGCKDEKVRRSRETLISFIHSGQGFALQILRLAHISSLSQFCSRYHHAFFIRCSWPILSHCKCCP